MKISPKNAFFQKKNIIISLGGGGYEIVKVIVKMGDIP
jgi:hypothetical protein